MSTSSIGFGYEIALVMPNSVMSTSTNSSQKTSRAVAANADYLHNLFEAAVRVLFPPRCAGCGLWCNELFCDACSNNLKILVPPLCALCGQPFDARAQVLNSSVCADCRANRCHSAPPLHALRSPLEYSGAIREAIHAFKYRGKTARAPQLAVLLHKYLICAQPAQVIPLEKLKLIIPVPLHGWRQWRRGYNQSTLLARELSKQLLILEKLSVPMAEVLRRIRHTTPQIELHERERAANIKGAFALDDAAWAEYSTLSADDTVLLLDDVTTTGATLFECAQVLTRQTNLKSNQIFALTLARAI